jgi:putative Mn2+ efflux pump MntP
MMTTLEIWLTALALAMDSFTVAITAGLIIKRVQMRHFLTIAFFFGAFQALMPLAGWAGSVYFYSLIESFDHWIAFAILVFLGVKMIREGIQHDEEHSFDPTKLATVLVLSVGVSIDALAVGISFTCMGMDRLTLITYPLVAIGLASFGMALGGCFIGSLIGNKLKFPVEPLGGVVLIVLGIRILCEHLM